MYVCICHAVTDRAIRQAVREGASCIEDLSEELNVATRCGKCRQLAQSCLSEAQPCHTNNHCEQYQPAIAV